MVIMIGLMQKETLFVGGVWVLMGIIYLSFNKYLKKQVSSNYAEKLINLTPYDNANNVVIQPTDKSSGLITELKNCLAYEHWNTSQAILDCIFTTDKDGLLLVSRQYQFAGSIVAYNYDEQYGYFGLYYVRPEFRSEKLGGFLTGAALARWGNRSVACDALLMQVDIYARIGFQAMYENRRYIFTPKKVSVMSNSSYLKYNEERQHVVPLASCKFNEVIDYDAKHFYTRREKMLQFWLQASDGLAFAYVDNAQQITGIIAITPAPDNYRIGPFFADNVRIAEVLLYKATLMLADNLCSIDIPLINPNIHVLINCFDMVEGNMKSIRMHKGNMPINNIDQVYGHLSIELG